MNPQFIRSYDFLVVFEWWCYLFLLNLHAIKFSCAGDMSHPARNDRFDIFYSRWAKREPVVTGWRGTTATSFLLKGCTWTIKRIYMNKKDVHEQLKGFTWTINRYTLFQTILIAFWWLQFIYTTNPKISAFLLMYMEKSSFRFISRNILFLEKEYWINLYTLTNINKFGIIIPFLVYI